MADFTSQPVVISEIPEHNLVIHQVGDQVDVNGRAVMVTTADTIRSNSKHYLRTTLARLMPRIENGEVAAIIQCEVNGKPANILITAEQWAVGAAERTRYETWLRGVTADKATREAKERPYDLVNNEGGEGYNPHRAGSMRTYARNRNADRDYPAGA